MLNVEQASKVQIKQFLLDNGLYMPNSMLSVGSDAKTVKGMKHNYMTGILYMIPDYELCPASKVAACDKACLVSAGRGIFNSVKQGRLNKTAIYKQFPHVFYELLRRDIDRLHSKAKREGLKLAIRLNGTSDIDHTDFVATMPHIQFYDYTKRTQLLDRKLAKKLDNYHFTFSYSGASERYMKHVNYAIAQGFDVAVVFKDKYLPQHFKELPVYDGDMTDLRFLDREQNMFQGVIGLYAKGQAKDDKTGFVVDNEVKGVYLK